MYKSSKQVVAKNTFCVELLDERTDREISLSVFPPKLKTLKEFQKIGDSIEELSSVISKMLSNNKENKQIAADDIDEILDVADMSELLTDYFAWIENIKKN